MVEKLGMVRRWDSILGVRKIAVMPKVLAACCAAAMLSFTALPAIAGTTFGVEGLVLSGTHTQPFGSVQGTGAGLFLQLDQAWPAVQLHVEGIPSVAIARINTTLGPVTASVGMFSATARLRLDRAGRWWVGAGSEVLSQVTPIAGLSKVDASRLAGTRLEIVGHFPTAPNRFIEAQVGATPDLNGLLVETRSLPNGAQSAASGAEVASLMDVSAAYGITRGNAEYRFGVRAINFAARFWDGREADRNVGGGVTAQIRFKL